MKLAIVGAGWAGMAAAVAATRAGHAVTVFEAARTLGGRARAQPIALPDGSELKLDNGQHIMIGAYSETLALMQSVGIDPRSALLALPLTLRFPDGSGLKLPSLPAPADAFVGIAFARGWSWRDKAALLRTAIGWQRARFKCESGTTVADLCAPLTPRVRRALIEPLCVAALNTPIDQASGQVFLRVIRDSLFGPGFAGFAGSNLLLPRTDLGSCFPDAAALWLRRHGGVLQSGYRVAALARCDGGWQIDRERFDAVLLATAPPEAARLIEAAGLHEEAAANDWLRSARALRFEAIATVYAFAAPSVRLAEPMLSLEGGSAAAPAQFVFDRGRLGGPPGLLAFVASASARERAPLEAAVRRQAHEQLGLADMHIAQTIIEKRATFACTPGLERPAQHIAAGLLACADYVQGPYPATLEGAVRSALAAVQELRAQPRPFSST